MTLLWLYIIVHFSSCSILTSVVTNAEVWNGISKI